MKVSLRIPYFDYVPMTKFVVFEPKGHTLKEIKDPLSHSGKENKLQGELVEEGRQGEHLVV